MNRVKDPAVRACEGLWNARVWVYPGRPDFRLEVAWGYTQRDLAVLSPEASSKLQRHWLGLVWAHGEPGPHLPHDSPGLPRQLRARTHARTWSGPSPRGSRAAGGEVGRAPADTWVEYLGDQSGWESKRLGVNLFSREFHHAREFTYDCCPKYHLCKAPGKKPEALLICSEKYYSQDF